MSGAPVIEIADPSLVVLIGAAGSGKSTFAGRHFAPGEVLSSDAFRGSISGDPADQSVTRPAFRALHRSLERRLAAGRLTVVDATNVEARARRELLRRAAAAGVPSVAIVLDLPRSTVHARNARRAGRVVPPEVVDRQLGDLARSIASGALMREGFASVLHLTDPSEVNAVEVRLTR